MTSGDMQMNREWREQVERERRISQELIRTMQSVIDAQAALILSMRRQRQSELMQATLMGAILAMRGFR